MTAADPLPRWGPVTAPPPTSHPATYTPSILDAIAAVLAEHLPAEPNPPAPRVFDPFAGVGKGPDHLAALGYDATGMDLEPEWAAASPRVAQGNALDPDAWPAELDAVVTSPAYGNRMADGYDGRDGSRRHTYRTALGRPLSTGSGAALQWGDEYRQLHAAVWALAVGALRPGGLLVVNVKNHVRRGQLVRVTEWHLSTLLGLGLDLVATTPVRTPGQRYGANGAARVDHEHVLTLAVPSEEPSR